MRFPLEVIRRVRATVGPDFPILYRFSQWKMDDYREIKFREPEDLRVWVEAAAAAGVALGASTSRGADPEEVEALRASLSQARSAIERLDELTRSGGQKLRDRGPVYPEWILNRPDYFDARIRASFPRYATDDGFARRPACQSKEEAA